MPPDIYIIAKAPEYSEYFDGCDGAEDTDAHEVASIAQFLSAPVVHTDAAAPRAAIHLIMRGRSMQLRMPGFTHKPLAISIAPRHHTRGGREPLLTAIGTRARQVVDMTAGWGRDAVELARHGVSVVAYERHRLVFVLLRHALQTCDDPMVAARLTLVYGDSSQLLPTLEARPAVVYLDPMYSQPQSAARRTAAPRKSVALLRALLADDPSSPHATEVTAATHAMFARACECAIGRVVVKRPRRALPIAPHPVGAVHSKLLRFDIYAPVSGAPHPARHSL